MQFRTLRLISDNTLSMRKFHITSFFSDASCSSQNSTFSVKLKCRREPAENRADLSYTEEIFTYEISLRKIGVKP